MRGSVIVMEKKPSKPQPSERMTVKKCKLPRPKVSRLEAEFDFQLPLLPLNVPMCVREYQFDANRKWRFDRCWPPAMVAIELEGGVHTGGRHVRGAGFEKDCEKMNAASLAGWKVGRFSARMVDNGAALEWLRKALRG